MRRLQRTSVPEPFAIIPPEGHAWNPRDKGPGTAYNHPLGGSCKVTDAIAHNHPAITPPLTGPGLVGVRALDLRTIALGPVERKSLPRRVVHRTGHQGLVAVIPSVSVVSLERIINNSR